MKEIKSVGIISPESSALFICDIQSKFENEIYKFKHMVFESKIMMKAAKELNIPIVVTEQYPKGLGKTIELISEEFEENKTKQFQKTSYSMYTPEIKKYLNENKQIKSIMIAGIDANVCVLQTCLDLIANGYEVHIIEGAVSSSSAHERLMALKRLKQSGAFITTLESLFWQLTKDSKHKSFKFVQKGIIEKRKIMAKL
ncbi:hypothetical protein DICPUDRAFT_43334 [Dictyostelium purpureum]|uniref:Isochorismatase-like domain-containing protein n=1 Tax=Dictyostelium purpureum TaxID=5786 RepID=F1A3Z7_DICPU|nr:uncharacterized protein DICPUDRAFT_43334 [Dictyostelium purpureum]EGC29083.1 hypothetical protein DICPUDRAFT_43334 [Dictyostelium purpureum]|eukprot:XP_003294392.1 hypothetical protein DICPUDRAFT_43334 [Dictyostelium purpureum]